MFILKKNFISGLFQQHLFIDLGNLQDRGVLGILCVSGNSDFLLILRLYLKYQNYVAVKEKDITHD